jgi:hypothetical protein
MSSFPQDPMIDAAAEIEPLALRLFAMDDDLS